MTSCFEFIDAKVALEHEMETLRHQLMRADEDDSLLTGVRTARQPPTELTGRQAQPAQEVALSDPDELASRD